MTTILEPAPTPYLKPLPEVRPENKPFFDALRNHQFVVPKCQDCGDYNWVPYPACRSCLSENQTWTPVSGDATVYTYTVCHRGPGAFNADVPYVIALGELVEQPRPCLVLGNLVGTPPEDIRVGMPIQIAYQEIPGEDITMWRWVARPLSLLRLSLLRPGRVAGDAGCPDSPGDRGPLPRCGRHPETTRVPGVGDSCPLNP